MEIPLQFIQSQKALSIACHTADEIWIANVFVGVSEDGRIFFISPRNTKHSLMIAENPAAAFSSLWFEKSNHKNRKGIQGLGSCRLTENMDDIETGVRLHNLNFPEFKNRITVEWIRTNEEGACIWILKPNSISYWDDALYGNDQKKEFIFS